MEGTRIEAVTPADIGDEDARLYCSEGPTFLRKNELACTLSHERCWQTMLDLGADRALVFEDDVQLSARLPAFLESVDRVDAELIRIDALGNTIRVYPVHASTPDGISLRRFRSTTIGAAGYIITESAARKFLGHPEFRRRAIDLVIYDPFEGPGALVSRVLTDPALCQQSGHWDKSATGIGHSDITPDGAKHLYPARHPLRYQVGRFERWLRRGIRNAVDHFVQKRHGLERRWVPLDLGN